MTVVVDASVMAEALDPSSSRTFRALDALAEDLSWIVPAHFLVEVASALRGRLLARAITEEQFRHALTTLRAADVDEYSIAPLLGRIAELAPNATTYDAAYVALAERHGVDVITMDATLARIPDATCTVRVL
ncbi:type II toxin-antitoxin system VapC family toxin [Microbacterium aurantiacum]|uniref:Ribonuclease VapC n=1 Tax=Microbacterium aurantiacum TaxID=162393 RepID=A0ABT8FPA4_9MICO|nr:type II toxin-antitoxin system VapC family toxin [Microbacterium aurantiacum]MDN4463163.1 type II toxin-antitoxin system VapC family toxin [Microbacterium aurantiacum]